MKILVFIFFFGISCVAAQPAKPMSHKMDSLCSAYKHHKKKFRHREHDPDWEAQRIVVDLADSFWKGGYSVVLLKDVMGEPKEITASPDTITKPDGYWDEERIYRHKTPRPFSEYDKSQKSTTWYRYEYRDPNQHQFYIWCFEISGSAIIGCRESYWWLGE